MAGPEPGRAFERRRFITRQQVEDAAASGQPLRVQGRDVVTDEAAQRAADLGVRIERASTPARTSPQPPPVTNSTSDADLRRAVRTAVIAELGTEPPGLDAAIDRVLNGRARR
jgi:hypothetical protein